MKRPKNNFWTHITTCNIDKSLLERSQKKLIFLNELVISLALYNIIHTILYIPYYQNYFSLVFRLLGFLGYIITYILLAKNQIKIGKIFFLFIGNFMMAFLKMTVANAIPIEYFQIPIICAPFLLFDWEEKGPLIFSIALTFIFLLIYHFVAWQYVGVFTIHKEFPNWLITYNTFSMLLILSALCWFTFKLLAGTFEQIENDQGLKSFTLDHAALAVIWVQYEGDIVYANDKAAELLGFEKSDLLQNNLKDLAFDFDDTNWDTMWNHNGQKEFFLVKRFNREYGTSVDLSIKANIINYKTKRIFCAYVKDVTDEILFEKLNNAELNLIKDINFNLPLKEAMYSFVSSIERASTQKISLALRLIDYNKQKLQTIVKPTFESNKDIWLFDTHNLSSVVFNTRNEILIENAQVDHRTAALLTSRPDLNVCLVSPIVSSKGQVLGTLSGYLRTFKNEKRDKIFIDKVLKILANILERYVNQRALRIQQSETKAIINSTPDVIAKLNKNGKYLFIQANQSGFHQTNRKYMIGKYIHDIFNVENTTKIMGAIHDAIQHNAVQTVEYQFMGDDDVMQYYETRIVSNGEEGVIGFVRNITDSVNARLTIQKNVKEMTAVLNAIPDIILKVDSTGNYLSFKNDSRGDLKFSEEEIIGRNFSEFFPDDSVDLLWKYLKLTLETNQVQVFDFELCTKEKCSFNYEVRMVPNGTDEVVCFVRNITEKVDTQRAIEQNYMETNALLNAVPDTILKINHEDRLLFCMFENPNDIHSVPQDQFGRKIDTIFEVQLSRLLQHHTQVCLKDNALQTFEYERANQGGANQNYEYRLVPGKTNEVIIFVREISEEVKIRRQLNTAIEEAKEAVKAKSQFLSNMSHEIRTPMNVIMGLTKILLQSNLSDQQRENLKAVKFSSENLLTIINDILDLSKIEAEKITFHDKDFNLHQFLKEFKQTFSMMASDKRLAFEVNIGNDIPTFVKGDKVRLNQILTNLTGNAIKFTSKGSVKLNINTIYKDQKTAHLKFEIIDTGIGIPEYDLPTIFDQFTQSLSTNTKIKGTGLGLAICKKLVELQGGTINVQSEIGKGSNFFFELIFGITKGDIQLSNDEDIDYNSIKGISILLAEDNTLNQFLAKQIFAEWGVEIDIANDGIEAIEMVNRESYHIILMDLQMPQIDGFAATKHIRKKLPAPKNEIPIVALTADAFPETRTKALAFGMNDFISKPFSQVELFDVICRNVFKNNNILNQGKEEENLSQEQPNQKKTVTSKSDINVDLSALFDMIGNEKSAVEGIFQLFKTDTKKDVEEMVQGLQDKKMEIVASTSHKLKSAFKTFGIHDGYELLLQIQAISKKGEYLPELEELIPDVQDMYVLQCEGIQQYIDNM